MHQKAQKWCDADEEYRLEENFVVEARIGVLSSKEMSKELGLEEQGLKIVAVYIRKKMNQRLQKGDGVIHKTEIDSLGHPIIQYMTDIDTGANTIELDNVGFRGKVADSFIPVKKGIRLSIEHQLNKIAESNKRISELQAEIEKCLQQIHLLEELRKTL